MGHHQKKQTNVIELKRNRQKNDDHGTSAGGPSEAQCFIKKNKFSFKSIKFDLVVNFFGVFFCFGFFS